MVTQGYYVWDNLKLPSYLGTSDQVVKGKHVPECVILARDQI